MEGPVWGFSTKVRDHGLSLEDNSKVAMVGFHYNFSNSVLSGFFSAQKSGK